MIYDEGDYFGGTVNIAARIASHATADQVLVGEDLERSVEPAGFRLVKVGPVELERSTQTGHDLCPSRLLTTQAELHPPESQQRRLPSSWRQPRRSCARPPCRERRLRQPRLPSRSAQACSQRRRLGANAAMLMHACVGFAFCSAACAGDTAGLQRALVMLAS